MGGGKGASPSSPTSPRSPKKPSTAPFSLHQQQQREAKLAQRIGQLVLSNEAAQKQEGALAIAGQQRAPRRQELAKLERGASMLGARSTITDWRMDLPGVQRSMIDPARRPGPGGGGNPCPLATTASDFMPSSTSIAASDAAAQQTMSSSAPGGFFANQTSTSFGGWSSRSSGTQRRRSSGPGRFRQRGFGIAAKESAFLKSGVGSAKGLGPGQYTVATGETTLWRHDLASNKVQQYLSHHKSPKLCSFTSGTHNNAARSSTFFQVPSPGQYSLPDLWGGDAKGTCFGRPLGADPWVVESRFACFVKAAKDLQ